MPNRLKNRIFVVLATLLVAMIPLVAVAQSPDTCHRNDREVPGDVSTPCKINFEIRIESVEYEFNPHLAPVHKGRGYSYCEGTATFTVSATPRFPNNVDGVLLATYYEGATNVRPLDGDTLGEGDSEVTFPLVRQTLTRQPDYGSLALRLVETVRIPGIAIRLDYTRHSGGKEYRRTVVSDHRDFGPPQPQTREIWDDLNLCIEKLHLEFDKQQIIAARQEQERVTRREEELKEAKSANELAIAKEIETISARIDALRLRVAKQIDVNVVELNLVRERTTKAAIEIDREITAIEIDTKRKYMQSLEDTARWINEWVLEKQDQWDDLAELQSQWKQRITEYQTETAQVIQDLEAKRAEIESSIAESERRQRELEAQIRDSQIDTSQLEAQLEAAQAELKAAQERLEELED